MTTRSATAPVPRSLKESPPPLAPAFADEKELRAGPHNFPWSSFRSLPSSLWLDTTSSKATSCESPSLVHSLFSMFIASPCQGRQRHSVPSKTCIDWPRFSVFRYPLVPCNRAIANLCRRELSLHALTQALQLLPGRLRPLVMRCWNSEMAFSFLHVRHRRKLPFPLPMSSIPSSLQSRRLLPRPWLDLNPWRWVKGPKSQAVTQCRH